jgi:hypothetical protein
MTLLEYIKYIDYNYIKGYEYEQYVLGRLHKFYDIKEIYLWKNVPYELLEEASIVIDNNNSKAGERLKFLLDTGIDLVAKTHANDILLVQCKCYQHRCISQKNLGGFYRILLDALIYNSMNNKKINVIGLIAHSNYLSDIITSSYCYKLGIVREIYIPFASNKFVKNKLKRYKDIVFIINAIMMIMNMVCICINFMNV